MNTDLISQMIVKASGVNRVDITPEERRFAEAFTKLIAEECAKVADAEATFHDEAAEYQSNPDMEERCKVYAKHIRRVAENVRRQFCKDS